jgi:single-stranded-DNA-specific exonuclease
MEAVQAKKWRIEPKITPEADEALKEYPPVLRQLLFNRHIDSSQKAERFLQVSGSEYDPFLMKDMDKTVQRILLAVKNGEKIAVYGDYDVDGVTATALLVQALKTIGGDVRAYIPHRFEEGYGVNTEALDKLKDEGVTLVVTVDCGIRSPHEADHAKTIGLDLIISDHHEPRGGVPGAVAVICPKQEGDGYPEQVLAGVGLAYKIAQGIQSLAPQGGLVADELLDLVAVGTVADIVPLIGENRSLVRKGLNLLRMGRRQGLRSLAGAAGLGEMSRITSRDIGFMIGPRLNAAGRLETAMSAYHLLMEQDAHQAGVLAQALDDQNRERQKMTLAMQEQAEQMIMESQPESLLFAFKDEFNMGVVGLVASRLVDTYYRPAIVGGATGEGEIRASCRSIPEFHITHALDECAELLVRHGGHAMAAGFTVSKENLKTLQTALQVIASRELGELDLRPQLRADMEIPLSEMGSEILKSIDALEPTGAENPEVNFVSRKVKLTGCFPMGKEKQHLRLKFVDEKRITHDAVAFRMGNLNGMLPPQVDILYTYERNTYNGQTTMQLRVKDIKPAIHK